MIELTYARWKHSFLEVVDIPGPVRLAGDGQISSVVRLRHFELVTSLLTSVAERRLC